MKFWCTPSLRSRQKWLCHAGVMIDDGLMKVLENIWYCFHVAKVQYDYFFQTVITDLFKYMKYAPRNSSMFSPNVKKV